MAKKTIKEMRLTFNEGDNDIIEFLNGKTSKTGYIKDLIRLHMQIEQSYLANGVEQSVSCETVKVEENKQDEFNFSLDDLGL